MSPQLQASDVDRAPAVGVAPSSLLRPVEVQDLEALVDLCAEHAAYEVATYTRDGQAQRLDEVLFASPPRLHVWVVTVDGHPQGFAAASLEYSTWRARSFVHLDCLYLRPSLRRQGWGSRLFEQVIDLARRRGCDEVQWQTPPSNVQGIAFYEALGAVSLAKRRFQLRV